MFFGEFPELCHTKMQTSDHQQPQDRRIPDPTLLALLSKNQESHQQTLEKLGELSAKLNAHIENEPISLANAVAEGVKAAMADAFPKGEPIPHREWHQRSIDAKRKMRDGIRNLVFEILKWAAIAMLGWLGLLILQGIQKWLTP